MQNAFFPQTKCCSITNSRPLMCEVILVTLHCIRVNLLDTFVVSLFSVVLSRQSLCTMFSRLYTETNVICPSLRTARFDENEVVARCPP